MEGKVEVYINLFGAFGNLTSHRRAGEKAKCTQRNGKENVLCDMNGPETNNMNETTKAGHIPVTILGNILDRTSN